MAKEREATKRLLAVERRRRGWSQAIVVDRMYQAARVHNLPAPRGLNVNYVSKWERGINQPDRYHEQLLCLVFELPSDRLGLPGDASPATSSDASNSASIERRHPNILDEGGSDTERREFLRQGVRTAFVAVTAGSYDWLSGPMGPPHPNVDPLAILTHNALGGSVGRPQTLDAFRSAVAAAKRAYQACRYADLANSLPELLGNLSAAIEDWTGDERLAAYSLSAEAHHVAASLLLKYEDHGLAWIVADRSMDAAERSGDPLIVASSARILTHAFTSTGHHAAAATAATKASLSFAATWKNPSADDLSIYGSLLLRAAIAAARQGSRATSYGLLDEASQTAKRLGKDDNRRWTAFGPTNVKLHEVHVAVQLSDAGTAIELARKINPDTVAVTERRASLYVDAAVALLQAGRLEQSYRTIVAAESLAPEETRARPTVRQLVADLVVRAPNHLLPELRELAARVGATGMLE
jgi:transcriptional regulator with XRE-family HTH domain